MKVSTEQIPAEVELPGTHAFALPQGLVGFADYTRAELQGQPDQLPFQWMRIQGPAGVVNFVVLEPGGVIPGYEPELFDADADALGISDAAEAMVLVILTLHHGTPQRATANLVGPVIVNRRTRIGRQLVISNYSRYSARHPLIARPEADSARASA